MKEKHVIGSDHYKDPTIVDTHLALFFDVFKKFVLSY